LPREGGTICDLGSGTGKALFASLCAHKFSRCVGIEILESLHGQAMSALSILKEHAAFRARFSKADVDLVMADFTTIDWSDAEVVIIHATVFDRDLMARIQLKAYDMPAGTFFIVVSKEIRTGVVTGIETLEQYRFQLSWGEATVSLQTKTF